MLRAARTLAAAILSFYLGVSAASAADEWVVRESSRSVPETVERLKSAIERSGGTVIAVVDHQEVAERAGQVLPPTTIVMFGNPRLSTAAIEAHRRMAIDLPLRIIVWEDSGVTRLGYPSAATLARRYDLTQDDRNLRRMEEAMGSLSAAALARGDTAENR